MDQPSPRITSYNVCYTKLLRILRLYAATEFCRDVMKNVVDRQLATSQFLKWLDSDVLSTARMHAESQTDR